ncbi:MAG: hypothetical protein HYW27_03560 [Candidatus Aenigmarchaeota archaeon]|nr:hypothetical protein [Candidatus Aenigmarchaeota archaeon]
MKAIGIYRELDEDERLSQESSDICELYSKTGMGFWSWYKGEKPEVSFARIFLTNKRLVFLSLFTGKLNELKSGKGDVSALINNWMEIPLETIIKVETPPKFTFSSVLAERVFKREGGGKKQEMIVHMKPVSRQKNVKIGPINLESGKSSTLSIIVENRDLWANSIETMAFNHRKSLGIGNEEPTEEGKIKCDICGTLYEENKVKSIKCEKCKKNVCREKRGVMGWKETGCFDKGEFLCISCVAKSKRKKK